MYDLANRTALVCGASQGIGAACARVFAEAGAKVILLARNRENLEQVKASCANSERHLILECDISDRATLRNRIQLLLETTGPIHICLANTAGPAAGSVFEATEAHLEAAFANHVLVNLALTQDLVPGMREAGFGRFIQIISTSVKIPIPNLGTSNTIRGAVAAMSKTLANELAPFGITVNNILPGFTATPRLDALIEGTATRENLAHEQVSERLRQSVPAKRFAQPHEIAHLAGFLASDKANYITGTAIPVDGGRTGCL